MGLHPWHPDVLRLTTPQLELVMTLSDPERFRKNIVEHNSRVILERSARLVEFAWTRFTNMGA